MSTEQHSIILARPVTSAHSREQDEWMLSGPNTPVGCKRPRMCSVTKTIETESAEGLQQETSRRCSVLPDLIDSQSSDENQPKEVSFYDI